MAPLEPSSEITVPRPVLTSAVPVALPGRLALGSEVWPEEAAPEEDGALLFTLLLLHAASERVITSAAEIAGLLAARGNRVLAVVNQLFAVLTMFVWIFALKSLALI